VLKTQKRGAIMAEGPVIPIRMIRELDRLRAAAGLAGVSQGRERLESKVSKSSNTVLQAADLLKAKSAEVERLERQIYDLKVANSHLVSRCEEAHNGLKEFNDQLQTQIGRAEAAEARAQRLENQLNVVENAKRETELTISRLTDSIEQSFSILEPVSALQPNEDIASVA
jgi:chromosome segregation ATPase